MGGPKKAFTSSLVLLGLLVSPGWGQEKSYSSSAQVKRAALDALQMAPKNLKTIRYVDIGTMGPMEQDQLAQVLGGLINSLSREPDIVRPVRIPGGLLRIDLADYGWPAALWDSLSDPYYQVTVETVTEEPWPGGIWPQDGQHYGAGSFRWKRRSRQSALAPWLSTSAESRADLKYLAEVTQSRLPITRGDRLIWAVSIQEGKTPGYYDFLGVKDQKTFETLIRFDSGLAAKLEQRRTVVFSGITQEPRRLERTHTVLGGYWRSFDSVEATDKKNPLRVLDDAFKFDVTERFSPLPNGLPAWYLGDAAGKRADKAPDNVVQGDWTGGKSKALHVHLSCVRCHFSQQGEDGIKPIAAVPIAAVAALDEAKLRELRRQYLRDLAPMIAQDQQQYAAAFRQASGMEAHQYAEALGKAFARYDEAKVDAAWISRDTGLPVADLARVFRMAAGSGTLDPVLSIVAGGGSIPIRQWEELIPETYNLIERYK